MQKEKNFKILGPDFGIIKQIDLPGDMILKLKNDDWGHYIKVINKNGDTLYNGPIITQDREEPARIKEAVEIFTQLHENGIL